MLENGFTCEISNFLRLSSSSDSGRNRDTRMAKIDVPAPAKATFLRDMNVDKIGAYTRAIANTPRTIPNFAVRSDGSVQSATTAKITQEVEITPDAIVAQKYRSGVWLNQINKAKAIPGKQERTTPMIKKGRRPYVSLKLPNKGDRKNERPV